MLDEKTLDRIKVIEGSIVPSDIIPEVINKTANCPACGGKHKLSVTQYGIKCYRPSCEFNKFHGIIKLQQWVNKDNSKGAFFRALEQLESRLGINYKETKTSRSKFLEECLDIYRNCLFSNEGEEALDYLYNRGFTEETLILSKIGFAPNSKTLRDFGVNPIKLREEGLLKGNYEYYSNRIIFPIWDYSRKLTHFVGRYLGNIPEDNTGNPLYPRYKDSQQTRNIANIKSFLIFEDRIRDYLKANKGLVITEGYPDTLTLIQKGVPSVGLLGLEKLELHSNKLKDFKEITFIFDNDQFPIEHPVYPGLYKSWRVMIPQIYNLQLMLPTTKFYIWMVPKDSGAKDINDWFNLPTNNKVEFIYEDRKEFINYLIEKWGNDLSKHYELIKLLSATNREGKELERYIYPDISPLQYAKMIMEN